MKSTIRAWNPDAGTYGDVLLTLYAPELTGDWQDEYALWDTTNQVAPLMGRPVAVFFDDEAKPSWTVANYSRRYAA
jgi:hypothetical protein